MLGNINIASGGTLAPGNSIGTLTVNGAADFASGSTLAVEVDGTKNADRLNVGGAVQIDNGARMTVKVGAGTYGPQTSHTVLTAAGGITGMFDVSSDLYFFTPTLQQLGSDLVLTLDRTGSVISLARNGNQLAAARAIEKLGDNSPVLDAFMPLDEAGARELLTSAAGEIHASGQAVIEQTFSRFTGAMGRHRRTQPGVVEINGPRGYVASGPQTQASQATAAMAASVAPNPPPPSFWIAPVAGMGQINDDGINGGLNWITGGITLGVDQTTALAQGDASVGLALGYLRSQADAGASSIDTSAGQIGVYGNLDMGPLSISGTLAYGLGYSDSRRTVSGGGTNLIASSNAFTHTLDGSVELAYAVRLTEAMTIAPLFRLDASVSQRGASVETGAGAFNLAVDESVWGQIDPSLGFEFKHEFATDFGLVTTSGGAAWRHSLVDAPSQTLRFAGTDASFTLNGRDKARDSLSVDLGIALSTAKDLRLFADYAGRVSADGHDHGVRVGLGGHL